MITRLVRTRSELDAVSARLTNDSLRYGVVAFGAEFDRRGRVAVVQLMPNRQRVYIVFVSLFEGFPDVVRDILRDPRVVKIGHSLENDERALGFPIASKLDVRLLMMRLGARIPALGARSRLRELMRALTPEIPLVDLGGWRQLTDWSIIDAQRIAYLEGDVRGVYEICAKLVLKEADSFSQLRWSDFTMLLPSIGDSIDRPFDQREWVPFNAPPLRKV
jgi:hypothetical protein